MIETLLVGALSSASPLPESLPPGDGSGAATSVGTGYSLGGLSAAVLPLDTGLGAQADRLSDFDRAVHVARFRVPADKLPKVLADAQRLKNFAHDALFSANPATRDPKIWDPSYQRWNPRFEVMTAQPVGRTAGVEAFLRIAEAPNHQGPLRWLFERQARAMIDQVLPQAAPLLFQAHWDNQDDTSFDGLIAVDPRSGEVSVVMTNDFA